MGYAIVGYFDKETDERIRQLWKLMSVNGIDDYLYHSENNPHIKFMMYEDIHEEKVRDKIEELSKQTQVVDVIFKSYSFYPNEQPFMNIDMAVSMELLKLQSEVRAACDGMAKLFPIDFFDKGIWKPDCQLTREIEGDKLTKVVDCLRENRLPIKGRLERIGLIKFHPARQIVDFELTI